MQIVLCSHGELQLRHPELEQRAHMVQVLNIQRLDGVHCHAGLLTCSQWQVSPAGPRESGYIMADLALMWDLPLLLQALSSGDRLEYRMQVSVCDQTGWLFRPVISSLLRARGQCAGSTCAWQLQHCLQGFMRGQCQEHAWSRCRPVETAPARILCPALHHAPANQPEVTLIEQ